MSFLSGILTVGKKAASFISGSSVASTLTKVALLGYAVNRLSKSALKDNNLNSAENIDGGVRLQLPPATNNKIPVLYGDAYFSGNITDAQLSNNSQTMNYCLTLAERTDIRFSTNSASSYVFKDVYWNDARIIFRNDGITADYTVDRSGNIDRSISGLVKVYCYAGSSVEPTVPENYSNNSVPAAYDVMPNWGLDHLMSDLIFAVVQVTYSREKNLTGLGNILFHVSNSMKTPGDCIYDYMKSERYGAGIPIADIDTSTITAINTYSLQSVNYLDQGTGAQTLSNRYQINGLIDTQKNVIDNLDNLCSAAGSWLSYNVYQGKWGVIINRPGSSVASFNDSNIIDTINIQGTGLQDLYNSVKVEFPHRDLRDSADFVTIEIPPNDRNANEYDNSLNINYEIINEPIQAQLLGFIELKQSRVDLIITFQTDYSYLNLNAGDIIDVTSDRPGWTNKLFRIISISEIHEEDGPIVLNFTALEYDANVYSLSDLFRFTRTDENGIITIGSIGVPGTPQVTKFEVDSRPRVIIESLSPTGIVSGMEFWITTDVSIPNDENRSYTLISTRIPPGGGVFSSGTNVVLDYDNLGSTNFLIKTRGFNATTVGPFSDPSGLVEFTPTQLTDAIGPDTAVLDQFGNLLTALAVVELLSLLNDLYKAFAGESLIDTIISGIEEVTGVDFGDGAIQGPPGDNAISVADKGTVLSSNIKTLNFDCNLLNVEVEGDTANISCQGGTSEPGPCFLQIANLYPPSRQNTVLNPIPGLTASDQAPTTGSYFIRFRKSVPSLNEFGTPSTIQTDILGGLTLGSGNIQLYKTDGTLVQTLSAGSCTVDNNILELPFNNRNLGTDYYILMDEGVVEYCDCKSPAINSPGTWDFNTPLYGVDPYNIQGVPGLVVLTHSYTTCPGGEFTLTFNGPITVGSGNIVFKEVSTGTIVGSIDASTGTLPTPPAPVGNFNIDPVVTSIRYGDPGFSFKPNTAYTFQASQGIAQINDGCGTGPSQAVEEGQFIFTTSGPLELISITASSTGNISNPVGRQANILLNFNQPVAVGKQGVINIVGHQVFDVTSTFQNNKTHAIIFAQGNSIVLQPTVDFDPGTSYSITADPNTVRSICGQFWNGQINVNNNFTTSDGPEPSGTSPDNGSDINQTAELQFANDVEAGPGTITITSGNNSINVPATDSSITIV